MGEQFKGYLLKHFECGGDKLRTRNENRRVNKTDEKEMPENGWEEIELRKIKQKMKRLLNEFSMDISLVLL
jgi:hypothetical protein